METKMRRSMIGLGMALMLLPASALAQSAAESFSYTAPSGMFGEGMAKWQMYKFMHEDRERMERFQRELTTGSIERAGDPAVRPAMRDRQVPPRRERSAGRPR
jgi:hypothetical protein